MKKCDLNQNKNEKISIANYFIEVLVTAINILTFFLNNIGNSYYCIL